MLYYLPEASDSRLFPLDEAGSNFAKATMLRLRLHILPRLLLGDRIFISEGWSLDSIPFLLVQHEVLRAVERLRGTVDAVRTVAFSPFVYEARRPGSYLDRYCTYLGRDDCEWSGLPILHRESKARELLRAKLAEAARVDGTADCVRVHEAFMAVLGNEVAADALAGAAGYLSQHSGLRQTKPTPVRRTLARYLKADLRQFCRVLREKGDPGAGPLAKEVRRVLADPRAMSSTSSFLVHMRQHQPAHTRAIEYIARVNYMRMSTEGVGASFSAPIRSPGQAQLELADTAIHHAPGETVEFTGQLNEKDELYEKLAEHWDWSDIWTGAIRLALEPRWQQLVSDFRRQMFRPPMQHRMRNMQSFKAMEQMLRQYCPDLTIEKSRGERIGLAARSVLPVQKSVAKVAVSVPLIVLDPSGAATVAAKAAEKSASDVLPEWMAPLSGGRRITSSLFRLYDTVRAQ